MYRHRSLERGRSPLNRIPDSIWRSVAGSLAQLRNIERAAAESDKTLPDWLQGEADASQGQYDALEGALSARGSGYKGLRADEAAPPLLPAKESLNFRICRSSTYHSAYRTVVATCSSR
jgi:hypothetical protein